MIKLEPNEHTVILDDGKWLRLKLASVPLRTQLQPDEATVARIRNRVLGQIGQESTYLVA
ncbi:MAG: hypothetical protein ABR978_06585 [Dehalococcoidia bacterium]